MCVTPSNSVFVGRQLYDLRKFADCAQVCLTALNSQRFLGEGALLEFVRLRCMSLARLGERQEFELTISRIAGLNTKDARAQRCFLEGFQLRMLGKSAKAVEKFRQSHSLKPNSFPTLRELSNCLMVIGEIAEAHKYAEKAYETASSNPYIIDLVLKLRIGTRHAIKEDILYDPTISDLLEKLERYGDEEGKSFYAIRMADIYRRARRLTLRLVLRGALVR